MGKNKTSTLIHKHDIMKCWGCDGKGYVSIPKITKSCTDFTCPTCKGTGKWVEKHYVVIDNVNKIAFDSDCGG